MQGYSEHGATTTALYIGSLGVEEMLYTRNHEVLSSKLDRSSMRSGYSFIELEDIHPVLGECNGNAGDAARRCTEKSRN
jgi:hypothetical protein